MQRTRFLFFFFSGFTCLFYFILYFMFCLYFNFTFFLSNLPFYIYMHVGVGVVDVGVSVGIYLDTIANHPTRCSDILDRTSFFVVIVISTVRRA